MRVLLALFCLIILTNFGCKQQADSLEFDTIVGLAYSNIMTLNSPDSTNCKAKKTKDLQLFKIKKDSLKVDSCTHSLDYINQVM
ncbi:hypothetical protein HDF26_002797 [Pedobacter cryoconitis]|uniref:Uncharacterized protein n=1 Tax=Pedobacter cryoconitis TaxID=188932 RepID=A0A7W8ZIJ0_9SPHI|nr:hypothetical protein [Pedobacter cryoconitis]MBB5634535.1 hypothetical protein [Pedobacter cryoconitis]MBB6272340.1 hypothetical protein [Pedobacter cryoconitis]